MHELIEFLRKTYVVVIFLVLEGLAISYYAHSSDHTRANLLATSNHFLGGLQGVVADIRGYFSLGRENQALLARITELEQTLTAYSIEKQDSLTHRPVDTLQIPYAFSTARVISNSINRTHNFMTIDRGARDGVKEGMGVLSPEGAMVGYVSAVSNGYAAVLSILNTSFKASGKIKGGDYFGSIFWDGTDRYRVRMKELSKYTQIKMGDPVVSTGFSQYFPAEILIGYVEDFVLAENQMSYDVEVRLAVDVSALTNVILVDNSDAEEIRRLEANRRRGGI